MNGRTRHTAQFARHSIGPQGTTGKTVIKSRKGLPFRQGVLLSSIVYTDCLGPLLEVRRIRMRRSTCPDALTRPTGFGFAHLPYHPRHPRVLVTAEEVWRGKPDPEGFLLAAQRLGVRIEECLIFEDSPAGVAATMAAGAHVAIVGGQVPESEGHFMLANYL
jgi:hypothetical protein